MVRRAARQREALRRARQRARERDVSGQPEPQGRVESVADSSTATAASRRLAATACAWCGGKLDKKTHGRIPKWCSAACRQRAWVQRHATESGRRAVEVVDRQVVVPVRAPPRHEEWQPLLVELTRQLETGAVYKRDLEILLPAFEQLINAARRAVDRPR